ncbi:MAG TPA: methyltransferase [Methylomirabilota bacterium]|jgi:release factor glutamine methyltransferase|nr:methyltransferase [Methylomirabilota bacterium]
MSDDAYRPMMSDAYAAILQRWHEAASVELHRLGAHEVSYLGLALTIPDQVFPPTPMSELLGRAVLDEVRDDDRVLDMGTGSGVNAILAAGRSHDVVGVDINPHAVAAAGRNAERNHVADRTAFFESDLFERVEGSFDLIVFDPPFRWFRPRDFLEASFADENYRSLTRFMSEVRERLNPGGRLLLFFGTSGDMAYLRRLIDRSGLRADTIGTRDLARDGINVTYCTFRLTS